MNALISWLGGETCRNLMMALAHTLWQGLLVGGLLYAYLRAVPAEAARRRYAASAVSLLIVVLAGLLTWSILNYTPETSVAEAVQPSVSSTAAEQPPFVVTPSGVSLIESTPAVPQKPEAANATQWYTWATGLWLLGAAAMLLRAVGIMINGGRLRRRCTPVQDETILTMVEQLRKTMRIGRRIRVLAGEHIFVPGVVGCFWPALLLPASMVSGTPTDDLKAIFAHELAHIRRFDYLVNFAQMVIEALLFFNPAVWWISRQMRIEREACCDVAGIALTGRKTQYAETLVTWAQKLHDQRIATAALIGFAGNDNDSPLLDRIRRIVVAGHRPHLRVSWPAAMGMLLLSGLALTALWQGAGAAVAFAGTILTPQQRIEMIEEMANEYGPGDGQYDEEDKILVSGTVRTYDGSPLPQRVTLIFSVRQPRQEFSIGGGAWPENEGDSQATFSQHLPYGRIGIVATGDGYAPDFAGPFEPEQGGSIEEIEFVLGEGFPGRLLVVDEAGKPIEGVQILGGYTEPTSGSYSHTIEETTDANGIATVEHAAEHTVGLRFEAAGYEPERMTATLFKPGKTTTITLQEASPTTGVVVAQATGEPLVGAEVHLLMSRTGNHSYAEGRVESEPDAVTDEEGRFTLTQLRRDRRNLLFIRRPGYGYRYLSDVQAGDSDLIVELGPRRVIRGTIIGDLSRLEIGEDGVPIIRYTNTYRLGNSFDSSSRAVCPVTMEEGIGTFEITDFHGQTVTITANTQDTTLDVENDDLDNVVIDLSPAKNRDVVLVFDVPPGAPGINGVVGFNYHEEGTRAFLPGRTEIADSQALCRVPVPCRFRYRIDYHQGKRPVGYWFGEPDPIDIPAGDEPFVIHVPVHPAGAIGGRVLRSDGTVADEAHVSLLVARKPDFVGPGLTGISDPLVGDRLDRGRFNATPLPLGGAYAIVANLGNYYHLTDAFPLDPTNPVVETDIHLGQGITLTGRLLDADGTPAQDPLQLVVSVNAGESGLSSEQTAITPNESGMFSIENVNPDLNGKYSIVVNVRPGYRPVRQKFEDITQPIVIQLERAKRLTGVVIDDVTGWPIPGVEVYAFYFKMNGQTSESENLEAEAKTNEQGEFVFSNMATREYRIRGRGVNLANPSRPVTATGGQADPIVLRMTIPEWSELKPHPPQED